MQGYILRRLVELIPTVLLVSVVVFTLHRLLPGDIVDILLGEIAGDDVDRARIEALLGIDKPAPEAYIDWLLGMLRGDLGQSLFSRTPIVDEILWRWPVTIELTVIALAMIVVLGIPIGIIAALRQESMLDYILRSGAVLGLSLPTFWIGVMVVTLPAIYLGCAAAH